jgi:hypothetical protein
MEYRRWYYYNLLGLPLLLIAKRCSCNWVLFIKPDLHNRL